MVWGAYLVLLTEFLSLFEAIDALWVVMGWLVPIAVTGAWLLKRKRAGTALRFPRLHYPSNIIIAGCVAVVVIVTAIVAWFAPPQTWDSLTYHMSRVAHWAQQASVEPFATGIEIQNSHPSLAEFAILQTYVLSNGDRFANFVEWSTMIGSLVGVSFIGSQLGASRRGQWLGVIFAATLPVGIVQASSTMNDYVVALWVVIVAAETLELRRHPTRHRPASVRIGRGRFSARDQADLNSLHPTVCSLGRDSALPQSWGLADSCMGRNLAGYCDRSISRSFLQEYSRLRQST